MTDYAWYAIKTMCYLILIGFAVWLAHSAMPLWALFLIPYWSSTDNTEDRIIEE